MLDAEQFGYVLWEGITLLIVMFGGIGLLVLRRKSAGNPGFTEQDYNLFFGDSKIKMSKPKAVLTLGLAVILCSVVGVLESIVLAPLGAGLLMPVLVLTCLAIVYKLVFNLDPDGCDVSRNETRRRISQAAFSDEGFKARNPPGLN